MTHRTRDDLERMAQEAEAKGQTLAAHLLREAALGPRVRPTAIGRNGVELTPWPDNPTEATDET